MAAVEEAHEVEVRLFVLVGGGSDEGDVVRNAGCRGSRTCGVDRRSVEVEPEELRRRNASAISTVEAL